MKMRNPQSSISHRIALSLCATAGLSILLAMVLQARTLSVDLEEAARSRLDRAAGAAFTLIDQHQQSVRHRHRAIARTPEFRANLETAHVPTLARLATALAERAPTTGAVLFTNRRAGRVAWSGEDVLLAQLLEKAELEPRPLCHTPDTAVDCNDVAGEGKSFLLAHDGDLYTATSVPLFTNTKFVGRFLVTEKLPPVLLREWSALAGETLVLREAGDERGELERVALTVAGAELRVVGSFDSERKALANLHTSALAAGAASLAFAFAFAVPLSRGLVRPIRTIETAANRIRAGDWSTRLSTERGDELGDVARALDMMLDHVETTQLGLQRAQRIGKLGGWSREIGSSEFLLSTELSRILELPRECVDTQLFLERVYPDDRRHILDSLRVCENDGLPFSTDHRVILANGSQLAVHMQGERIEYADGSRRVEGTIQDITERKDVEEEVRQLAYEDGLTGLGNRRLFGESLQRAIESSKQRLVPLAIIFLDLDDFKNINDTLGHSAGDILLRTVASRIVRVVERLSSTEEPASVHRLGGDEFAVLMPCLAAGDAPLEYAKQILRSLSDSVELDGYDVNVSASIGIARWPDEGDHAEALLQGCDTAMYHAKRQGRGHYRVYDASMRESVERRLHIESRLRGAIEREELRIFYQPKVEIESGRVTGFEALLRWFDPELGVVRPDEFVALAESTGQILALGAWVLHEAACQAVRWNEQGVTRAPIAVNVSSMQLDTGVLIESVREVLEETGVAPEQLELEVTESALLRDEEQAIGLLREVKKLGLGLSLDDFGTGYSSLSYLSRLPVDSMKIDRSFVENIEDDVSGHSLLGSIVSMAKGLGLRVVAEGVETDGQRELLAEMGCDVIQGYLYSAAVPARDVPLAIEQCEAAAKRDRSVRS